MNIISNQEISLKKDTHEYKLSTHPNIRFTSVTTFVEQFFEGFDAKKIASKLIANYSKYSNFTVESLIAEWKQKADYGTHVHNEIESWIKKKIQPKELKSINGKNWLENYQGKSNSDIFSEVIIYSTELKIAGTIDIIAKDNSTGSYELIDWKTSRKIDRNSYKNKMGTHITTNHVMDCNFYHYSLQLSLYRYILEKYYDFNIKNQLIIHLKDDGADALVAPYMKNEIIAMLSSNQNTI